MNGSGEDIFSDETYLELGVDFSLTGGKGFKGAVKDVYFVTQWENANGPATNIDNFLLGGGLRWNVPGFIFFDTNIYYRENDDTQFEVDIDNNWQLTTAWALPFNIASSKWRFDGFFDWTTATDYTHVFTGESKFKSAFHTQPQLKLDLGDFWGQTDKYYVGVEVDYWKNKLGGKEDQTAVQAMVQINF